MRKITIPAYTKEQGRKRVTFHGPIEISFDDRQFSVIETKWLDKYPAYAIRRGTDGPIVATIPTNDPDSIWQPGEEQFVTRSSDDGAIVSSMKKESWWRRRSPLQIKFCSPIPCF